MDANETRPLATLIRDAQGVKPTLTITFRPDHAVAATGKVIDGLARPDQLVDWAQAVHFAEQVHAEEAHQDLLTQFLLEISTPELFEPVTREVCQRWLRVLQTPTASGPSATGS
jgi:hypothetical protein